MTHDIDLEHAKKMRAGRYEQKKYDAAIEKIRVLEIELEGLRDLSANTDVYEIDPLEGSSTSQATVFAIASDWHVEEIVDPKMVQGRNKYNPAIAKTRATTFFQRIVKLTNKERQDVRIDNLVLCLLGDFISGNIHDELLENCVMRPVEAIIYAQELIASGLQFILDHGAYRSVTVVCKSGNHARITKKLHHSTESGNSLEFGMYCALKRRFPTIRWIIEPSYLTYIRVYGRTIRLHHGWAIKSLGGVGGIYPALLRAEYQWNMHEPSHHTLLGHFHSYTSHGRGNAVINGSLIGYNAYAVTLRGSPEPPTQAMFLLDKKRGVTVQIPILL